MEKDKKYYLRTYGCQANERDSQDISSVLDALGLYEVKNPCSADIIILNSCSVRQKSEDKVYGFGKKIKEMRNLGKKPFVILAGCMVGSAISDRKRYELSYLKDKIPWVDLFLSLPETKSLPRLLKDYKVIGEENLRSGGGNNISEKPKKGKEAYINISTGCDNFCTFCVVPYARGPEVSRSKEDILREIETLTSLGFKKFLLIGQNVNSWGLSREEKFRIRTGSSQKLPFADLLRDVHDISGVEKISFISSNPFDFTQDLVEVLSLPKISRYLHIAVQSGDDEILRKMNRRHTVGEFKELVRRIRQKVPDIELGTDIIVGFPGEAEEQFQNTVSLCKEIKFNVVYISAYSERLGTAAQKIFKDDVPLKEKKRRYKILRDVVEQFKASKRVK